MESLSPAQAIVCSGKTYRLVVRMAGFALYLLALMMLAGCATQKPGSPNDPCRPTLSPLGAVTVLARIAAAAFTQGRSEEMAQARDQMGLAAREACEENFQASQRSTKVCAGALENLIDSCKRACKPHEALGQKCVEATLACQALTPCLWMSTGKSASEYDKEACLLSIAKANRVCGAALADQANVAERTHADVQAARI